MKVLHIYKSYPPVVGGIEGHLRLLAESQVRKNLDVTVLVASAAGRASVREENGVQVIRTRPWGAVASTPLSPGLARWVRRIAPDVTHLHFPYPPGELAHWAFGKARVTIVSYHSDIIRQRWLGRLYGPLMRQVLHKSDRVLVGSSAYLRTSRHLSGMKGNCCVVPYGIDPRPFQATDPSGSERIRGSEGTPLVMFVGRFRYYKGVDVLIEAAADINARILLVGTGPMERRWRDSAARSPAASRIRFLGHVPDDELPFYYAAADVVVLPSSYRSESFGLVLLEAMAAGRPVVSTELGTGTSFVNQHGETGLVVASGDADALAGAVNELLHDPEQRRRMGANGRRRVLQEFHFERMVDRTMNIYEEALTASRHRPRGPEHR